MKREHQKQTHTRFYFLCHPHLQKNIWHFMKYLYSTIITLPSTITLWYLVKTIPHLGSYKPFLFCHLKFVLTLMDLLYKTSYELTWSKGLCRRQMLNNTVNFKTTSLTKTNYDYHPLSYVSFYHKKFYVVKVETFTKRHKNNRELL